MKKLTNTILVVAVIATLLSSCDNLFSETQKVPEAPSYVQTGPAGGWVFYDCDADNESGNADGLTSEECGWRYLEAAPSDLPGTYEWGDLWNYETQEGIGTGKSNTEKMPTRGWFAEISAAKACLDYSVNGYDDWFLPSIDELSLMYYNLRENRLGDFSYGIYWSSTENFGINMDHKVREYRYGWARAFGSDMILRHEERQFKYHVRPIRAYK